jgi:hypothetical protein
MKWTCYKARFEVAGGSEFGSHGSLGVAAGVFSFVLFVDLAVHGVLYRTFVAPFKMLSLAMAHLSN